MQCPQCHQPVDAAHRFCATCGAPVVLPKQRRNIPWRPVIISAVILLVLGTAGFLYFLQATREVVLWVAKMTPAEANAVAVANQFLSYVNAGDFDKACSMNENSREYCTQYEVPRYRELTQNGASFQALYAQRDHDARGYWVYTVVVRQSTKTGDKAFFLEVAPDSPKAPVITGPLSGTSWDRQIMRRLGQ